MESVFITRGQMADGYGISTRTLKRRLEERGFILNKGLISPKDQENIRSLLGYPKNHNSPVRGTKL
jgi:hypothetical protein